ncbi:hypothetical protein HYT55_04110 [Candidatus Woesearchaeota archaeon]|nr:hypothetical protein [Candidatus Woesearchaeota archaeon]
MKSWHGIILLGFEHFWSNLRIFAFQNRTVFELLFVFLYAFEQVLLIGLSYLAKDLMQLGYIVSFFAIIVLTTFAVHKILMDSRIKMLEEQIKGLQQDKFVLELSIRTIKQGYEELFGKTEYLNKVKSPQTKKGVS